MGNEHSKQKAGGASTPRSRLHRSNALRRAETSSSAAEPSGPSGIEESRTRLPPLQAYHFDEIPLQRSNAIRRAHTSPMLPDYDEPRPAPGEIPRDRSQDDPYKARLSPPLPSHVHPDPRALPRRDTTLQRSNAVRRRRANTSVPQNMPGRQNMTGLPRASTSSSASSGRGKGHGANIKSAADISAGSAFGHGWDVPARGHQAGALANAISASSAPGYKAQDPQPGDIPHGRGVAASPAPIPQPHDPTHPKTFFSQGSTGKKGRGRLRYRIVEPLSIDTTPGLVGSGADEPVSPLTEDEARTPRQPVSPLTQADFW